jgi:CRP-like cAMP-binding protein
MDQEVFQTKSELLRRMSAVDFALLKPYLRSVFLDLRAPLEEAGQKIKFVYFLESGLASVVAKRSAAAEAEVGIIGFEGMTASALIMGDDQAPHNCYIQSTCEALQIDARHFVDALETSPTLRPFLLRYVQSFHVQASYTAWVNARSTLEPRLARWLLMCSDRTVGDRLVVTHEFLSIMLGVRRPGVTVGLQQIEGKGFIRARAERSPFVIEKACCNLPASGMGHPRRNIAGLWVNWDLPHPPGKNVGVPSSQTRQRRNIGQRPG